MVLMLNGDLQQFYDMLLRPLLLLHGYNIQAQNFRHPMILCEVERRAIIHQIILLYENTPSAYHGRMS